ncbi:hypothetical protein OTB20_21530 [Streptomyces sp. H27-H1]|uniref:hypothetical protein n=1 Tax=Streptomyces sp. H27-H1 TaxID=2996461 RepID=UPI00226DCC05|nr:hypothetical protein [Streptomyces sp. H27-H1]MCY0928740.1 hypothetical protein [Streptomyces sp. H27-H1]
MAAPGSKVSSRRRSRSAGVMVALPEAGAPAWDGSAWLRDLVAAADGPYAGWILDRPADCVAETFEDRTPGSAVEAFREALAEFLDLFVEPGIDMMQDGDPALLVRLGALLARLSALPADPRHDAMRTWILQVREDWYAIAG